MNTRLCSIFTFFILSSHVWAPSVSINNASNQSTVNDNNNIWHYPFSLRVHYNYSTTSADFKPDFKYNARHKTFAKNYPLFRLRRQAGSNVQTNPEENNEPFLYEGDIISANPFVVASHGEDGFYAAAAVRDPGKRWPIGPDGIVVVPYELSKAFRGPEIQKLREAMKQFEQVCVKWRERTANDKEYVTITSGQGCAASIGVRKTVPNTILLAHDCFVNGTLLHEMMHVLGFFHEVSRPDRNAYVTIDFDNVQDYAKTQFKTHSPAELDYLNFEYDYGSLMHYPINAFAIDNTRPTIIVPADVEKKFTIGQRVKFSPSDLGKLRALTQCKILQCDAQKQFKCADGTQCLPLARKCDGTTNCPDGSDEVGCPKKCNGKQFTCSSKCIPRSWYCDGTRDCIDGSDEPATGCPKTCGPSQFRCEKDNICIEIYKKCNGKRDCSDGTDESISNCPAPPLQPRQTTPTKQYPAATFYIDPCLNPQTFAQFYQYCAYNYRRRIFYQQNPYFDFTHSFDAIEAGVNFACGLNLNSINNKLVNIDFDYIMQHAMCHNLIIHNAFIRIDSATKAIQVTLPATVEKFVRSLRAKVKATQAKARAPRKMEIYLGIGGPGRTRMLSDLVRQGPAQTERFAHATRAYARTLDVDGIVLDWRSNEIGPLFTVVKQLEKAVRTDPKKSASTIDLQLGVVITDELVKAQKQNKVMLMDLTRAVDYVLYISSTFGDDKDYGHLEPNNKMFLDTLQNGLPLQSGGPGGLPQNITKISEKFFLPFNLGAKFYSSNPDEPNSFDSYAAGPAFAGVVSQDPGRLSAGEACATFDKPAFTKETRGLFIGDQVLHEPVAFEEAKTFASYETPCSAAEKIAFFNKKSNVNNVRLFAGIYVPDISLDDTKGSCATNALHSSLLSVISLAVQPVFLGLLTDECAKNDNDYSWRKPLTALISSGLEK